MQGNLNPSSFPSQNPNLFLLNRVPVQRRHHDSAVEPLVAAVAENEAQEARAAGGDRREAHELLLQGKNRTVGNPKKKEYYYFDLRSS